jgi:aminopeptidase YwaD
MKKILVIMAGLVIWVGAIWGQKPPLLAEKEVAALANELSGEGAKRNLEGIARFHRQRGSKGFHEAAELVAQRLRGYGLSDVAILQFPADGKIFYGTQRSRPAWDAEFAELWEAKDGGEAKLGSFDREPVVLAEDSESADVAAELVNVGEGTKESDYAGKDVKGKMVLVSAQPGAVQDLAVGRFAAVGIVSYAQNQKTAWSGENLDAIRWGHLETFSVNKTFGFMVSLRTARGFQERLTKGEKIKLHAVVKAGQHVGNYEVATATIPGADPKLKDEEIVFSCHLDHQRPGANDNASGCATILEVARTLQKLIADGSLARPARTIRFVFPPEIEGTLALLNGTPELAKRIKAVVHMDMVGGGPETKAVFHVTRGPMSLPSFVQDVAWAFAEWVNEETYEFAATGKAEYPIISAEGGKEPLQAVYSAYTMGSDHDVYQDSSFGIPAIYLNDWPDRYIHTNLDTAANIDATKLKRAAFIGGASGYFLAVMKIDNRAEVQSEVTIGRFMRDVLMRERTRGVEAKVACVTMRLQMQQEINTLRSVDTFLGIEPVRRSGEKRVGADCVPGPPISEPVVFFHSYKRKSELRGPMQVFGYDYALAEWAKLGRVGRPQLSEQEGLWGGGDEYGYEVLNFVDGKRNALEIRDAVSAEYGPVPVDLVVKYLNALQEIGVVAEVK